MSEQDDEMQAQQARQVDIERELVELRAAMDKLNNQKFFRMHSNWFRFMWMSLVRGLFVGLGSVIGATLLLYFLVEFLSNIDFIPIIGEWGKEIVEIINGNGTYSPTNHF